MRFDPAATVGDAAISLLGVSKKYHLYDSAHHRVLEALHPLRRKYHRDFWALRDISLEVPRGATLGILGVNGSGKSTLLQIVCSILQPTVGQVNVQGRVAALIELGAGFNPDLTGRQNADFNCLITGLSRQEIRERVPQIEAFADIGAFFDQPVKTYSSGMFMRVAFATAIHVDPDILVIDEALAVGDARFQQKCFRKFRDFQDQKKTILYVTHDRFSVPKLCTHGLVLDQGRIIHSGDPGEAVDRYSALLAGGSVEVAGQTDRPTVETGFAGGERSTDACSANPTYNKNENRYGLGGAAIVDYRLIVGKEVNPSTVKGGSVVEISVKVRFDKAVAAPLVGLSVKTKDGIEVYGTHSGWLLRTLRARAAGELAMYRFRVPLALASGDWFFDVAVAESQEAMLDTREALFHIQVLRATSSTGLMALDVSLDEGT
jgi:lipopolysaccharide transport system ATP-binding protein